MLFIFLFHILGVSDGILDFQNLAALAGACLSSIGAYLSGVASKVAVPWFSAIAIAFTFFAIKEIVFPIPEISGKWYVEIEVKQTSYNPYQGMKLRYEWMLLQEGNKIKGKGEKFWEKTLNGICPHEYVGRYRIFSTLEGYIEKNYLKKSKLSIYAVEQGQHRESICTYNLCILDSKKMKGNFDSTAANKSGYAICQREPF